MRLLQLALKLGIAQHEIITFLQEKGITIPENGNTKVEDEHVKLIAAHFGMPKQQTEPEENAESPVVETVHDVEKKQEAAEAEHTSDVAETVSETAPVEVIRAKKIKLEGIKVLGKIDLPEPVKKSEEQKPAADEAQEKRNPVKREKRKNGAATEKNGRKNLYSKRRNTETYEQKLKREEREAAKKKRQLKKKLKQQKKKYYEEQLKLKQGQPQKPKKKSAKKIAAPGAPRKKKAVPHKNPIRRLWDWLNGRYD